MDEIITFQDLPTDGSWLNMEYLKSRISFFADFQKDLILPIAVWENIDVCIFHAPCCDGTAAAFAVGMRYPNCVFYGVNRGSGETDISLPAGLEAKNVLLVDYVYSEELMMELVSICENVYVIDHHASEWEMLTNLGFKQGENLVFSLEFCASFLAWKFFHKSLIPILYLYINDNDTGSWEFTNIGKFMAGFSVQGVVLGPGWSNLSDFENFKIALDGGEKFIQSMIVLGIVASEIEWRDVYLEAQRCVDKRLRCAPEFVCRVLNVSASVKSGPLVRALLNGTYSYDQQSKADLTFLYYRIDRNESFKISLRSDECDVGKIANALNGGGHVHAASFTYYGSSLDDLFLSLEEEKELNWQTRLRECEDASKLAQEIVAWIDWYNDENAWDWSTEDKVNAMRNNWGYPICELERKILNFFPEYLHHLKFRGYEIDTNDENVCHIGQLRGGDYVFYMEKSEKYIVSATRDFENSWTVDTLWPVYEAKQIRIGDITEGSTLLTLTRY